MRFIRKIKNNYIHNDVNIDTHLCLSSLFQLLFFSFFFSICFRCPTEHKTASLADEGNSAYCQSSGAHNIKHISK